MVDQAIEIVTVSKPSQLPKVTLKAYSMVHKGITVEWAAECHEKSTGKRPVRGWQYKNYIYFESE